MVYAKLIDCFFEFMFCFFGCVSNWDLQNKRVINGLEPQLTY